MSLTPILDELYGNISTSGLEQDQEKGKAILTIRMNLMERLDSVFQLPSPTGLSTPIRWPGVVFQGRDSEDRCTNLSLINSEGMSSALREAWKVDKDILKIRQRLEEVLKLFVRWNWDLFPEIHRLEGYRRLWPGSYTSLLDVLRAENGLKVPLVIGVWNAEEVAGTIFEAVKSRVQEMAPNLPLLKWPDCPKQAPWANQSWLGHIWKVSRSLAKPRKGSSADNFRWPLRFAILKQGARASTESCEAALEVEIYRLAKRVMAAWPDQFPASESRRADRSRRQDVQEKSGLCRDFMRGFCRYGERCREPHVLR
ncbi:hypothetical protein KC349_g5979 [Hortaea werneckii]|nr:hypothetical protein KC349_g5979 [Hortaea werneckii]